MSKTCNNIVSNVYLLSRKQRVECFHVLVDVGSSPFFNCKKRHYLMQVLMTQSPIPYQAIANL